MTCTMGQISFRYRITSVSVRNKKEQKSKRLVLDFALFYVGRVSYFYFCSFQFLEKTFCKRLVVLAEASLLT